MKKFRQYRSDQGRSPKKREKDYKMVGWSLIGLFITILFILITQK